MSVFLKVNKRVFKITIIKRGKMIYLRGRMICGLFWDNSTRHRIALSSGLGGWVGKLLLDHILV